MSRSLVFALGVVIGILACTLVWGSSISRDSASISSIDNGWRELEVVDYV